MVAVAIYPSPNPFPKEGGRSPRAGRAHTALMLWCALRSPPNLGSTGTPEARRKAT